MTTSDLYGHLKALQDAGFTIVKRAVSCELTQALIQASTRVYESDVWLDPSSGVPAEGDTDALVARRDVAIQKAMPHRRDVLMPTAVRSLLAQLLDDEPMLLSEIVPFRYSPSRTRPPSASKVCRDLVRNAHVHHFSHWEPRRGALMVWLALEDIQSASGPMWICPESHRRNLTLFDDVLKKVPALADSLHALRLKGAPPAEWGQWFVSMQQVMTELIESRIDTEGLERRPVLLEAGDLMIFDPALSHGTIPPSDPQQTRWSLVARFQGRHTIERGWASWLGNSVFEPALKNFPPMDYSVEAYNDAWVAVDDGRDYERMFWEKPLA